VQFYDSKWTMLLNRGKDRLRSKASNAGHIIA